MKKIALLLSSVLTCGVAMAQIPVTGSSLTYTQDFNSLDTLSASPYSSILPNGWSLAETGTNSNTTYRGGNGASNTGDTYSFGTNGTNERALGGLASGSLLPGFGARFSNNTGTSITSFAITYKGEQWRLGNTASHTDSLYFSYSTNATSVGDAAATWIQVPAAFFTSVLTSGTTSGAVDGNTNSANVTTTVVVTVPNSGVLTIKWEDPNIIGSDDALAVDDLSITFATGTPPPPSNNPIITALTPADNSTNIPATTNSVQITFDKQVTLGTGNMNIKNVTDQTNQTIVLSSTNTTIAAHTATVNGINLLQGKSYYITFDSTAFDTAGYRGVGIYDSTKWNFSTQGAPPPVATSLNENFDASCGATPSSLPVGWMEYSVVGSQTWNCGSSTANNGNNGTKGLQMNGYQGGNNANEDWLITPQLDLSAMSNVYFRFDHWKRFAGADLEVLLSSNYSGTGDPNAATWTNVGVTLPAADTSTWKTYEANITSHKVHLIHLAFKYVSTTTDGRQSRLDNVLVSSNPLSVNSISKSALKFMILGNANQNEVTLGLDVKAGNYQVSIYDLAGREVYKTNTTIQSGMQQKTISGFNLTNGMYIIRLYNNNEMGTAKFIVE